MRTNFRISEVFLDKELPDSYNKNYRTVDFIKTDVILLKTHIDRFMIKSEMTTGEKGQGYMDTKNKPFIIVRAQQEDAAALLDYLKIVGRETENLSFGAEGVSLDLEAEQAYLRDQSGSADNAQYLAKVNGEIIGTASLNRKHKRMSHRGEFGISVKKAWWGSGAASALMEAILAFAKENNFEQLNLEVRGDNTRAIRLYEKYGFRKLCTFPAFFKVNGEYIDFELMNLSLQPDIPDRQK